MGRVVLFCFERPRRARYWLARRAPPASQNFCAQSCKQTHLQAVLARRSPFGPDPAPRRGCQCCCARRAETKTAGLAPSLSLTRHAPNETMPAPHASALWRTPVSSPRWEQLRARHSDLQREAGHADKDKRVRLAELDAWVVEELPARLSGAASSSSAPPLTKNDLVRMVEWKLLRGKWRPALLGYAKAQTDAAVGEAWARAHKALGGKNAAPSPVQLRAALDALCSLRGVGPATASIVLCAATGGQFPYMGDEALEAALGTRNYKAEEAMALAEALRAKAGELRREQKQQQQQQREWTAEDVQRALHAAELEAKVAVGVALAGAGGKKKKKEEGGADAKPPPPPAPKRQKRR